MTIYIRMHVANSKALFTLCVKKFLTPSVFLVSLMYVEKFLLHVENVAKNKQKYPLRNFLHYV